VDFLLIPAVLLLQISIILRKKELLLRTHNVTFQLIGVCDSKAAITAAPDGGPLDMAALLAHKETTGRVDGLPGSIGDLTALDLAQLDGYDVLVEATLASSSEPGLSCVKAALEAGKRAVLANKGPLVKDFEGLHRLAELMPDGTPAAAPRLAYSATVCGGLPVLNVGCRDMPGAIITKVQGVFNSTTNYILAEMGKGGTYDGALAEAQRLHIAEAEPSLDVDGWDTAFKLIIITNAILGCDAKLDDVAVVGIRGITPALIQQAADEGLVYKLVATAALQGETLPPSYALEVKPVRVPKCSFVGLITGWEMGVVIESDLWDVISLKIDEPSVVPTSAAVLRDILHTGAPGAGTVMQRRAHWR